MNPADTNNKVYLVLRKRGELVEILKCFSDKDNAHYFIKDNAKEDGHEFYQVKSMIVE